MTELKVFENEQFGKLSVMVIKEEPWFIAKQITEILGYKDAESMTRRLDEDEKMLLTIDIAKSLQIVGFDIPTRGMTMINESGLYSAILGSSKTEAKPFKKWITSDLLPTIRKTANTLKSIEYRGYMDGLVFSRDGKPITTSTILCEYTGKQHKHILRDIRDEIAELKNISPNLDTSLIINDFKEVFYLDSYGREQIEYELGEMATMQVLLKYSAENRAKFIITFNKMRQAINNMFKAKIIDSVLPQDSRLRQYVYVIKNPLNETVKIGVAQDVDKRIKQLQTGAGIELELIYKSLICSNAFSIENDVHKEFDEYRTFGEWFKINPSTVINFLETKTYVLNSEYSGMLSLL